MKTRFIFALMAALLSSLSVWAAYDFQTGGVYYSKLSDNTVAVSYLYRGGYSGVVAIPEKVSYDAEYTVVAIGSDAFSNCSRLSSISIPSTVTSIGDNAFNYCSMLTEVVLPAGLETLGSGAFSGCRGLTKMELPAGLKSIGGSAFNSCSGISEIVIPEGVTVLCESIFYGCTGLATVTLHDGITEIGRYAFNYCSNLTSIDMPASLETIGQYAFNSCRNIQAITIPATVTKIDSYAFFNCGGALELTFEDSDATLEIGTEAFSGVGATEVYIGRTLETAALSSNGSVKNVTVSGNATAIAADSFKGCGSLESVSLGKNVASVGSGAFDDCTSIRKIEVMNPVPPTMECTFADEVYSYATVSVPKGALEAYKSAGTWKDFTNIVEDTTTSVSELTGDSEVVFYDLSGLRINGDLRPGLYIRRQGKESSRILVK